MAIFYHTAWKAEKAKRLRPIYNEKTKKTKKELDFPNVL